MDGFACSSWYFLRFPDPRYEKGPFNPDAVAYWLPVDLYVGGAEHAVMHLPYARFWTKVMYDAGLVDFDEPFIKLVNQGMVLASDGSKMSKSRGNVIPPDGLVEKYGASALRTYELFMGPFEEPISWSERGVPGTFRFLARVWRLVTREASRSIQARSAPSYNAEEKELRTLMHRTIKKVTDDLEALKFNTAVAALMEYVRKLSRWESKPLASSSLWREAIESLVLMLAPIAPALAEELWHRLGREPFVICQPWPRYDPALVAGDMVTIAVQVDGKLRARLDVERDIGEKQICELALLNKRVRTFIGDRPILKTVFVPGRILNFVTKRENPTSSERSGSLTV